METKSVELNDIWKDLKQIFLKYEKMTNRVEKQLNSLSIYVETNNNHCKIHMNVKGKPYFFTISKTPSDRYAGRQILRQIRRTFENDK